MKILEAPVLEHISQICMSAHMFHLHAFQQQLRFRIIDTFNLLVIKEVLLFTFMFHDLEASCVQFVLVFRAADIVYGDSLWHRWPEV